MRVSPAIGSLVLIIVTSSVAAAGTNSAVLIPPVDASIARTFDPPDSTYGPGHRGIDYAVVPGTRVRASGPGIVAFAGNVAGTFAITIDHGDGLETTYSDLGEIWVGRGVKVGEGKFLGSSGDAHDGTPGLHFGVKLDGIYVDPEQFFGPMDLSEAIHLAPLVWKPSSSFPAALADAFRRPGTHERGCVEASSSTAGPIPPNDNVAVAIAGIGSSTIEGTGDDVDAEMYREDASQLGYPPNLVYEFSYRGIDGGRLHERYSRGDTYGDIRDAAAKLATLVTEIARRHPRRDVDLITHSQGGLVARTYLARARDAFDERQPRIEHLVTFATPHEGAPLAGEVLDLNEKTRTGAMALAAARAWSLAGGPIPDPFSPAVAQISPGSDLVRTLAQEDVMFGTRTLALAIPNDLIVPASNAQIEGEVNRIVAPRGLNGHAAIVGSSEARRLAYDFLRDGALSCPTAWEEWGSRTGRAIAWAQGGLDGVYRAGEAMGRMLLPF